MGHIRHVTDLIDYIFIKEDRKTAAAADSEHERQRLRETLASSLNIHDERILQKLVDMRVRPETLASLMIVPLVAVAWADWTIDDQEKRLIHEEIETFGDIRNRIDFDLLEKWMEHRPPPELLDSWRFYLHTICQHLSMEEFARLKTNIITASRAVADIAPGFLRFDKMAKREMVYKLEFIFDTCAMIPLHH